MTSVAYPGSTLSPASDRKRGSTYSPWSMSTSQWSNPCGSWETPSVEPSPMCHLPTIAVR